jgi:preprotein translocase subunit YajC
MELLFPVLLIAVFYFVLIRPQQKQRKKMLEMQREIGPGSQVMTGGGLIGTVVSVDDEKDQVILEVSPGVTNTYVRRAVVNVLSSPSAPIDETYDSGNDTPADDVADGAEADGRDDIDKALDEIENASKDSSKPGDDTK